MRIESFLKSEDQILKYFSNHKFYGFSIRNLQDIFNKNRELWQIANYRRSIDFVTFILNRRILIQINFSRKKTLYIRSKASIHQIARGMKKDSYLAYYTAAEIHNLTRSKTERIYSCTDREYNFHNDSDAIDQTSIDRSFAKPFRASSNFYEWNGLLFYYFEKKRYIREVGIVDDVRNGIRYTNIERTLIDIAIKPVYAEGFEEVLYIFERAIAHADVFKMKLYLEILNYSYPYGQVIGFYLEKAGYSEDRVAPFLNLNINYDFYLMHNIEKKAYSKKWRLYYPEGF